MSPSTRPIGKTGTAEPVVQDADARFFCFADERWSPELPAPTRALRDPDGLLAALDINLWHLQHGTLAYAGFDDRESCGVWQLVVLLNLVGHVLLDLLLDRACKLFSRVVKAQVVCFFSTRLSS